MKEWRRILAIMAWITIAVLFFCIGWANEELTSIQIMKSIGTSISQGLCFRYP